MPVLLATSTGAQALIIVVVGTIAVGGGLFAGRAWRRATPDDSRPRPTGVRPAKRRKR